MTIEIPWLQAAMAAVAAVAVPATGADLRPQAVAEAPGAAAKGNHDHGGHGPGGSSGSANVDLNGAVELCVAEVESNGEAVDRVDAAIRGPGGWRVSGALERGDTYSCRIGDDGATRDVRVERTGGGYGYGTAPAVRVEC